MSHVRQLSGSFTIEVSLDRLVDELAERLAPRILDWLREAGEDVAAATAALNAALDLARLEIEMTSQRGDSVEQRGDSVPSSDEVLRGGEPDLPITGGAHYTWPVGHHDAAEEA